MTKMRLNRAVNPVMSVRTNANWMNRMRSGTVMWRNVARPLAPSTRAAS